MALSTVSRWLKRIGLGKRSRLEPPEPPNRYERAARASSSTSTSRSSGGSSGRRAPGDRQPRGHAQRPGARAGGGVAGWEFVHVCVDDATRLAFAEVLADERGDTAAGFLRRAVAWFESMGVTVERVMSDNGSCYRSPSTPPPAASSASRHLFTQPYRPRTNGKAERFIQTLKPLGLRSHLRHLSRADRGASRLAHPLQLHPTTWLPRPQIARSSARRAGTTGAGRPARAPLANCPGDVAKYATLGGQLALGRPCAERPLPMPSELCGCVLAFRANRRSVARRSAPGPATR